MQEHNPSNTKIKTTQKYQLKLTLLLQEIAKIQNRTLFFFLHVYESQPRQDSTEHKTVPTSSSPKTEIGAC